VHVRGRRPDLLDHSVKRDLTVDEHLDGVPVPRRRSVFGPTPGRRVKNVAADPLETARVVPAHLTRDLVADELSDLHHHRIILNPRDR
jgi:hypothetical protein